MRGLLVSCVGVVVSSLAFCQSVKSDLVDTLLGKVSHNGNAVVIIRAGDMLSSPRGTKEAWASSASVSRPLPLPGDSQFVVTTAEVNPANFDLVWQTSILQTSKPFALASAAAAHGGLTEDISGFESVWMPNGGILTQFSPQMIGVSAPANRQKAAKWVAGFKSTQTGFTPYLDKAIASKKSETVLMALDLSEAWSAPRIAKSLEMEPLQALEKQTIDNKALADVLASAQGVTLAITVTDGISAAATVQFSKDAAVIAPVARDIFLEVLDRAGLGLVDFQQWQIKVEGSTLVATGPLTTNGLGRLLSLIDPNSPEDAPAAVGSKADLKDVGAASLQYYKSISATIDRAVTAATSAQESWLKREAQRINAMPVMNVDPALVQWGADIAGQLTKAGAALQLGQTRGAARAASVQMATGGYGSNDPNREAQASADRRVAEQQRRQAMLEEKSRAAEDAAKILNEMSGTRAKIRTDMSAKYGVEF